MTGDEFPHSVMGRIVELAKVVGSLTVLVSTASLIWASTAGPIAGFFVQWEAMQESVELLHKDVKELKGENRVIRETPGLTYVSEPVHVGDPITFNVVLERTTLGLNCVFESSIPMYIDERNIAMPGPRNTVGRQIRDDPVPIVSTHQQARDLRPGRVSMYLILQYECNGKTVFDRTTSVAFLLLERSKE